MSHSSWTSLPKPEADYSSKAFTMLTHSASSDSRQTGLPARLYQYVALL